MPAKPCTIIAQLDGSGMAETWGVADFITAEEMGRTRGYWWAKDSQSLIVEQVDTSEVEKWTIADPASPLKETVTVPYPAAGTANTTVRLHQFDLSGNQQELTWDRSAYPYLVNVVVNDREPMIIVQMMPMAPSTN